MDDRDRQLFQKNWISLLETIRIPPLVPHLKQSGIFTDRMIEEFTNPSLTCTEQKRKLLQLLPKRGPNAKTKFVECLVASGLHEAAHLLQEDIQIPPPIQRSEVINPSPIEDIKVTKAVAYYGGTQDQDSVYTMISNPRGIAVIFIYKNFLYDIYSFRNGADLDGHYLNHLFNELGYNVMVHVNKTSTETWNLLTELQKNPALKEVDSLIIAFSSHGEPDCIVASDNGHLKIEAIYKMFNNYHCPFMNGKPKIFLIQACRGTMMDDGIKLSDVTDSKGQAAVLPALPTVIPPVVPTWTDMLIAYSTVPGYVSHRNQISGSWFFEIFTRVVMENAWNMHLLDLFRKVHFTHKEPLMVMEFTIETLATCSLPLLERHFLALLFHGLARKWNFKTKMTYDLHWRASWDGEKQSPELVLKGWTKDFYFNPGL